MSRGIGCRHGLDLVWLWLWHRLAAVALIRPPAWEPPYAAGFGPKKAEKKKKKKRIMILETDSGKTEGGFWGRERVGG